MIAVAVLLKTESGDDYLYLDNHNDIVKNIVDNMGDEIEYVWSMDIEVYPENDDVWTDVSQKLNEARGNV